MARLYKFILKLFSNKYTRINQTLEFNGALLRETIARDAITLHSHTDSGVFKKLYEVFTASRNLQIIELSQSIDETTFRYNKGRLDALHDVVGFFDLCEDGKRCETIRNNMKATRGASIHSINKPFNK